MERKKIIIVAALAIGIIAWRMGAMQQGMQAQTGQEMITVYQKDAAGNEVSIEVPWDQLQHFAMFSDMRDAIETSGGSINKRLPLSNTISMDIFKALLADNAARRIVKTMPAVEFNKEALELLIVRLNAANFLQHAALIEQYSRQIADMITSDGSMRLLNQSDQTHLAFITDLFFSSMPNLQKHILEYMGAEIWVEQYKIVHNGEVYSAAMSADGTRVVTGSYDGMAKIVAWDGNAWIEQYTIPHTFAVRSVAISVDNTKVVTGSFDGTAKIVAWDGNAWREQHVIQHDGGVGSVAISADGKRVVTGSNDHTAKIFAWNGNAWTEVYTIQHNSGVSSVAISADGTRVVTGSFDRTAKIVAWNGTAWIEQDMIQHNEGVKSVAISADGTKVVSGSEDRTAKIVGNAWADQYTIRHNNWVGSVAISADGTKVVSGSGDRTAKIVAWNGNAWIEQYTIPHNGTVDSVAISVDNTKVVTGSFDGTTKITVWNGTTWVEQDMIPHAGAVLSIAISADGNRVVTGSSDKRAQIVGLFLSSLPGISDFDTYLFEHLLLWAKRNGQKISQAGWVDDILHSIQWSAIEPGAKKELKKLIQETVQQ